ncbi:hypothetical protein D9756_000641 [Leucocoprinus leucothites]|uniref:Uncharacterized protein n=1 Tax=Leucocoprinus leucothites TaxID=201217 RepID=A0A8H5GF56_9AGAR|nr:hypothetical protein D9756_000641 [Leucoagaricus leucothites]
MVPYTSSHNDSLSHAQMTRRILWKLDCRVLPPLALLWLANFIDRSNIGNARIAGLERDAHLQGNQFNIVLAVFYATYLVVEVPSNIVMKKIKPNRWIPILVAVWGVTATLTNTSQQVNSYGGLLAIRLCLGLCEGGLLPGMVLYLSMIYKRHEFQLRVGIFYASASLSGAFGGQQTFCHEKSLFIALSASPSLGLLASAIIQMEGVGGLAGWRWIFILEGIATILAAGFAAIILPADLASANFLTQEERDFAVRRFREDGEPVENALSNTVSSPTDEKPGEGTRSHTESVQSAILLETHSDDERFEWREVVRGSLDIQVWLSGIAYLGLCVSLYSYSLFLPTIISGLGYSVVVVAYLADLLKWRGPFILICLPLAIIGYIIAVVATDNTTRYIAVFFMAAGVYPSGPCILSILPNNSRGHYKRATTTALQLAIANMAGFPATFVYTQGKLLDRHLHLYLRHQQIKPPSIAKAIRSF